jgi:hypothetical protein
MLMCPKNQAGVNDPRQEGTVRFLKKVHHGKHKIKKYRIAHSNLQ